VRTVEKSLHDELSASVDNDGTDGLDCENYMFSVTANSDVHTALLSSCDTAQEAGLFRQLDLVYQTESSAHGDCHFNKTGYFWTV
jgi:hypothetical protein